MILSGDKDFIQLHKYKNVTQYSPITKKFVNGIDPDEYLYEHILKGDVSDGVPNVLSVDNTFTDGLYPSNNAIAVGIISNTISGDAMQFNSGTTICVSLAINNIQS